MAGKRKAKASKAAIISIILSLLCVAVLVVGILSEWFTHFWIWNKDTPGTGGGDVVQADDALPCSEMLMQQSEENGIRLFSAPMRLADVEDYEITPYAENVQTLTATVSPTNTTYKAVDYTCAWKNAASSWATGKDVNNYVSLIQATDGDLTCAVSVLQPIGEQVIITCTARPLIDGDWVPSATCTLDYYQRVVNAKPNFGGTIDDGETNETDYSELISDGVTLKYEDLYSHDPNGYGWVCRNLVSVRLERGIGTVGEDCKDSSINVKISIADSVAESIKSAAGISTLSSYTLAANGATEGLKIKTAIENMLGGASNVESHRTAIYRAFNTAYNAGTPVLKFELNFSTNLSSFKYSFTHNVKLNPMAMAVRATNLELDKDHITV